MGTYVRVSGVVFALVALGHLLRVVAHSPLVIGGRPLPAAASLMVFLAAAFAVRCRLTVRGTSPA
jgi:hypothetical protein